jgi:DNA polymerase-1
LSGNYDSILFLIDGIILPIKQKIKIIMSNTNKPLVILLDVNNALHRYFHTTTPKIYNEQRIETADAVLGYVKKLIDGQVYAVPEKVIAVADNDDPTFRHYLYEGYKGDREGMKPELARQEDLCHQAMDAYGVPVISKSGVEADDSMGMLARYYEAKGYYVLMITTDKDMHQLLTDSIHIFHPQKKVVIDVAASIEKFGIEPHQVADLLAIMGDKVDCIDGLFGVGEKTASKWLQDHGSLEKLIRNSADIKGKAGENLRANYERLLFNKSLTIIQSDPKFLTKKELDYVSTHQRDEGKCELVNKLYGIRTMDNTNTPSSMPPSPPIEAYMNDPMLMG